MPQPVQHQQVPQSSSTPKSNPPQTNRQPDAFAQLAEEVVTAQAFLNNPKSQKSSARHQPVRLAPQPDEPPRQACQEQNDASPESSLPQAAFDQPADASQTPPSGQPSAARRNESVAASATSLPEATLNQPAAAKRTPSDVPDPASLPPCFFVFSRN